MHTQTNRNCPIKPPGHWTHEGCHLDHPLRVLREDYATHDDMTTDNCHKFCGIHGYTMAGTQAGTECYCGHKIDTDSGAGLPVPESECDHPCVGKLHACAKCVKCRLGLTSL